METEGSSKDRAVLTTERKESRECDRARGRQNHVAGFLALLHWHSGREGQWQLDHYAAT